MRTGLVAIAATASALVASTVGSPAAQAWTMTAVSPLVSAGNSVVAARLVSTPINERWEGQCTSASGRYWGKITVDMTRSNRPGFQWDIGSVAATTGDFVTGHSGNAYVFFIGSRYGTNGIEGSAQSASADMADNEASVAFQGTVGAPDPFNATTTGSFNGSWVYTESGPAVPGAPKAWYAYTYRVTFMNKNVIASDQNNVCSVYLNYGQPGFNSTQAQRAEPVLAAPSRPIYRSYNASTTDYLLGTTKGEGSTAGFVYQKVAFNIWPTPMDKDIQPIYRCKYTGGHFLSTFASCEGKTSEGLQGYLLSKQYSNSTPVYRCYKAGALIHLSTVTRTDCNSPIGATDPWKIETVQGYVRP
jgi:hypothetical protein